MRDQGFIKLSRKFFENALWKEPRQYSRSEAWLDLIQMAGFEDSKYILNNRAIEVQRGEIVASRRFLENRWSWGSTKVTNFLDYLKKEGMIKQRQTSGQTIITLCNYGTYNDSQTSDNDENKPKANQRQTSGKPATNQNKESKEGKESKEEINIPPVIPPTGDDVLEDDELSSSFPVSGNATSVPHAMSKPSSKNHTGDDELEKLFDEFRKAYPTQKRGLQTEFANFKKKHKDWKEVLPLLLPAIQAEIAWHEEKQRKKEFCPQYKNFQTWINQRCWEQEFVLEDPPVSSSPVKPKDGELNDKGQVWSEQLNRWLN